MSAGRFEVTVEVMFSASHQLRGYKGVIEPLHGHNFRVEATVATTELDRLGLGIDFLELEALLKEIVAPWDHRHLNEQPPFVSLNPTTELMARQVFEALSERLAPRGIRPSRVRIWEAPNYSATYTAGTADL